MAIEIIKRGEWPKPEPIRINCGWCGTLFSFEVEDADQVDPDGVWIRCPVCDNVHCKSMKPRPHR